MKKKKYKHKDYSKYLNISPGMSGLAEVMARFQKAMHEQSYTQSEAYKKLVTGDWDTADTMKKPLNKKQKHFSETFNPKTRKDVKQLVGLARIVDTTRVRPLRTPFAGGVNNSVWWSRRPMKVFEIRHGGFIFQAETEAELVELICQLLNIRE